MMDDANALDLMDLDDDVQDPVDSSFDNQESAPQEPAPSEDDFDLTKELLTLQGISDINKIKFEDESGAVIEKSWDSLSNNEKLMILSHQEDPDTKLDASEIELINQIRESGMTPDQYIQSLQTTDTPPPTYEVDNMSDDELFCLDLLDKVGSDNITDEELQQALDNAKLNDNLYKKQVASLRVYYKDLEDKRFQQEELDKQAESERDYAEFSNNIVEAIRNFNALEDVPVELSTDEMEDLANYILTRDSSGYSEFGRLLNDPQQFTKAAFWVMKGSEILKEMQNQIKEAYLRGYNEHNTKNSSLKRVFTRSESVPSNNQQESQFAYFDESSYLHD